MIVTKCDICGAETTGPTALTAPNRCLEVQMTDAKGDNVCLAIKIDDTFAARKLDYCDKCWLAVSDRYANLVMAKTKEPVVAGASSEEDIPF